MVAIVTASILPYSYTIPHNSPSYLCSFSSSRHGHPPPPPLPLRPIHLRHPHYSSPSFPQPAIRHQHPLALLVGSRRFSLLALCSPYSIPRPLLLFPDTTSADIKLRYQLPRRQTTARSPAMNLRVGARVLCSLSVDKVNIATRCARGR